MAFFHDSVRGDPVNGRRCLTELDYNTQPVGRGRQATRVQQPLPSRVIDLRHSSAPAMKVEGLAGAITRDGQAVVFPVDAAPLRHAAALSRLAVQVARALPGFQSNEMDASTMAANRAGRSRMAPGTNRWRHRQLVVRYTPTTRAAARTVRDSSPLSCAGAQAACR